MALHVPRSPADPWWRIVHASADLTEAGIQRSVTKVVKSFRRSSLGALEKAVGKGQLSSAVQSVNWKGFEKDLHGQLEKRILRSMRESGLRSATKLNIDFDPNDRALLKAANLKAKNAARLISNESRAAANKAVRQMQKEGLSPRQISRRLRPMLGTTQRQTNSMLLQAKALKAKGRSQIQIDRKLTQLSNRYGKHRARNIARFEGLGAGQYGADSVIASAMEQGQIEKVEKKWVRANADACPICKRLNGQRVGFDRKFIDRKTSKKYDAPPEPHGNCRCGLHYYFKKIPKAEWIAASEMFHLPGRHDQSSHGRKKGTTGIKGLRGSIPTRSGDEIYVVRYDDRNNALIDEEDMGGWAYGGKDLNKVVQSTLDRSPTERGFLHIGRMKDSQVADFETGIEGVTGSAVKELYGSPFSDLKTPINKSNLDAVFDLNSREKIYSAQRFHLPERHDEDTKVQDESEEKKKPEP